MTDIKPTRKDRDAAHVALYGQPRDVRPGAPGEGSKVTDWLVNGTEHACLRSHLMVAEAIAQAREEGRREALAPIKKQLEWFRREVEKLSDATDPGLKGRRYEYTLDVQRLEDLLAECEEPSPT